MQALRGNLHRRQQREHPRFDALLPRRRPALKIRVITHELLFGAAEIFQHAVFEYLHLLLGILQRSLAKLEQLRAALIGGERFL